MSGFVRFKHERRGESSHFYSYSLVLLGRPSGQIGHPFVQSRRSSYQIDPMGHAIHLDAVGRSYSAAVVQSLAVAANTCCPSLAAVDLVRVQAARRTVGSLHSQ